MPQPFWIDWMNIMAVSPAEPVGKAILDLQRGNKRGVPTRYGGARLGDISIDDAYVYPPPVVAAEQ
jgi:hypothetical protein